MNRRLWIDHALFWRRQAHEWLASGNGQEFRRCIANARWYADHFRRHGTPYGYRDLKQWNEYRRIIDARRIA